MLRRSERNLIVLFSPCLRSLSSISLGMFDSNSRCVHCKNVIGAAMVLGIDVGNGIPLIGFIATVISLIAITTSTIWQKKLSNNLPLPVSNFYQALGGFSFHLLIIIIFVDPYINFTKTFIFAMSHQIFLVSFGAFTILMYLIKKNSASKTVSIFFLIPPTSAFMAWVFLNEKLNTLDLIGFVVASIGVYIATRNKV